MRASARGARWCVLALSPRYSLYVPVPDLLPPNILHSQYTKLLPLAEIGQRQVNFRHLAVRGIESARAACCTLPQHGFQYTYAF